ncbi:TonB-dependent siderophore receptor [Chroococcidiopsis sp. FACHB-1243]|uniref:TonB-dependent siderophore receptor n=1 Tax=Chroococcidiopsis sp. [FACHB-1243] TaxID=2692781 RepID=UPI00177CA6B3|nr:TonB-dependent siderophore receptor [Chroococcidiopsis sp. [FACHB-1243]]MBD2308673.1 TonB-dependent siderophore receptor [Chroococcidiopsis sp. [FACHB-1243]]
MKVDKLCQSLLLTSAITLTGCFAYALLLGTPAKGDEVGAQIQEVDKNILQPNEIRLPTTSAQMLESPTPTNPPAISPNQEEKGGVVSITGVVTNPTDKGVEIILQTTQGNALQPVTLVLGRTYIANIPNAVLALPQGEFRQDNPASGITRVAVTQATANSIRVAVTGETALPQVQLSDAPNQGLIFSFTPGTSAAQTPPPLGETQPEKPTAQTDEQEIVVTGEQDGYLVPDTNVGTRTDTPLRDIPQSIQVIPQEVIRDQGADVYSALRNVASIRQNNPSSFTSIRLTNRGFFINDFFGNTLRNGIKDVGATIGAELAGIERIEVFQGPASVLFGNAPPGGSINLITKQPLSDPYYSVEANIGSYDFYRGAVDISGLLDTDKKVAYRLNTAYKTQNFFHDFSERKVFVIAPVVSFEIGENTKLTLEADYVNSETDGFFLGLPLIGTVLPNPNGKIPRNRNLNKTYESRDSAFRIGYALEHKFSHNWSLRNTFRYGDVSIQYKGDGVPTGLLSDNRTVTRGFFEPSDDLYSEYNLLTDIIGKFSTGSIEHQLLFGVDLRRLDRNFQSISRVGAPIDVFNPVYGQPPGAITSITDTNTLTDQLGIYIQDQVTIAENLKLLLGVRFDTFKQDNQNRITNLETSQSGDSFSPRVGIVYQPIPPISLYASYNESFNPVIGTAFDASTFEPEQGKQYEIGVKADLTDRLSATLAFYDLTRSNLLTTDNRPGIPLGFSIQTGEQRSQGIEFNIAGEILPGWNVFASYAYTDLRVTKDNILPIGSSLNGVAKNAASLWTTYDIQNGKLQGLGFGLGLFYVGDRSGFLDNTYELPGYLTTDAAIYYKQDRLRAALNFRNLFNVDYFENSFGRLRISYGAPFTVQGTISWEF